MEVCIGEMIYDTNLNPLISGKLYIINPVKYGKHHGDFLEPIGRNNFPAIIMFIKNWHEDGVSYYSFLYKGKTFTFKTNIQ